MRATLRTIGIALAIAWMPLVLLGIVERLIIGQPEALLRDLAVHVRLLVALPLLLVAERGLARATDRTLARLTEEGLVAAADRQRFALVGARHQRLRRMVGAQLALAVVAVGFGVASLFGHAGPLAMLRRATATWPAVRSWYAVVTLPTFVFFVTGALWRWLSWVVALLALARLPLQLGVCHPDRRGGAGFLTRPSVVFFVPFLGALSSVVCAAYLTSVWHEHQWPVQLRAMVLVVVGIGVVCALGPLLAFTPQLYRFAFRSRREVGALASDYARRFGERWLTRADGADPLGTSDLQSFADLGNLFRESVEKTSMALFGVRQLVILLVAALVPVLPVACAVVPLDELVEALAKLIIGPH